MAQLNFKPPISIEEAIAAERERCARICEQVARENRVTRKGEGASLCVYAIRKE